MNVYAMSGDGVEVQAECTPDGLSWLYWLRASDHRFSRRHIRQVLQLYEFPMRTIYHPGVKRPECFNVESTQAVPNA